MTQNFTNVVDVKIRELTANRNYKIEEVFNLGVQLGRYLERENQEYLRLSYFSESDEKKELRTNFGQLHKKVCDLLERLVKASIKEQITLAKFRRWSIGFDTLHGNKSEFESSIVQKRYVQFTGVDRGEGESFIAYFEIQGKIKDLFERHNQPTHFEIIVDNDYGEDYVSISKEEQIDSLYGCMISYNCDLSKNAVEKYAVFVSELEKSVLFLLLSD